MINMTKKENEIYSFLIGDVFLNYDTFINDKKISPIDSLKELGLCNAIIDIIIELENEYEIDFKFLEYIDLKTIEEIIKLTIKKLKDKKYERRLRKITRNSFQIL